MSTPTNHDDSKVVMGTVGSSDSVVTNYDSDPASFPAGTAVKLASTGALSKSSGSLVGVSLGESLSDTKKTAVCRAGNRVPILLTDEGEYSTLKVGDITFTALEKGVAGDSITIALTDTESAGEEAVEVDGTDIVIGMEGGVSTATQIVTAVLASPEALALISEPVIDEGDEAVAQAAAAEAPLASGADSYPYVVKGTPVKIDGTSGLASSDGTTSGAMYIDEVKTGVKLDGSTVSVAIIDMGGGL